MKTVYQILAVLGLGILLVGGYHLFIRYQPSEKTFTITENDCMKVYTTGYDKGFDRSVQELRYINNHKDLTNLEIYTMVDSLRKVDSLDYNKKLFHATK